MVLGLHVRVSVKEISLFPTPLLKFLFRLDGSDFLQELRE